jgi:hypothetical protein
MKCIYTLLALCLLAFTACKKDKKSSQVTVTIAVKSGFGINSNTYAAVVENPDPAVHSFLCVIPANQQPGPTYSCANAVYINNLPANLAVPGKKVTFSHWKDNGQPALFSSINHAHELEVHDAREAN